jgi:TfoX/Sxy family transcriptional regulator of competence genes
MAYDPGLAERLRDLLSATHSTFTEKKMFGGLSFLLRGNMCCGVIGDELIVRVGKDGTDPALAEPGARVFDFSGRPMAGWVTVAPEGTASDEVLAGWVRRALDFVEHLPPK